VGAYAPSPNDVYSPAFKASLASIANAPFNYSSIGSSVDGITGGESAPVDAEGMESEPVDIVDGGGYGIQPNEPWRTKFFKWYELVHWYYVFGPSGSGSMSVSDPKANLHKIMTSANYLDYQTALINLDKLFENYKKHTEDWFWINNWAVIKGSTLTVNKGGSKDGGLRACKKEGGKFVFATEPPEGGSLTSNHYRGIAYDLHSYNKNGKNNLALWNYCTANCGAFKLVGIENRYHTNLKQYEQGKGGGNGWVHVDWAQTDANAKSARPGQGFLYAFNAKSSDRVNYRDPKGVSRSGNVYWYDKQVWKS
jgi:hypothetical protein